MKSIRRFRVYLEEMKDHKLNRILVGTDKYGNKYYQYYSSFGLPTRREVFYFLMISSNYTKKISELFFFIITDSTRSKK